MDNIYNHRFIIFGTYAANTLGQIRSLGQKGISPIAVLVHINSFRIDKSKYFSKVHNVSNINEGLNLIIKEYGNETAKPFLYTDRDDIMGLLNSRFNELKDKFHFWNAGDKGFSELLLFRSKSFSLQKIIMNIGKRKMELWENEWNYSTH